MLKNSTNSPSVEQNRCNSSLICAQIPRSIERSIRSDLLDLIPLNSTILAKFSQGNKK